MQGKDLTLQGKDLMPQGKALTLQGKGTYPHWRVKISTRLMVALP